MELTDTQDTPVTQHLDRLTTLDTRMDMDKTQLLNSRCMVTQLQEAGI
jgi:hypothetical protein